MRIGLLVTVMVALVIRVEGAEACSCGANVVERPLPDATDVPRNAVLVLEYYQGSFDLITLRDATTQAPVPLALELVPAHGRLQYGLARPTAMLAPFTTYEILENGHVLQAFTTDDRIHASPATAVALTSFQARNVQALGAGCFDCDGPDDRAEFRIDYSGGADVVFASFEYYRPGDLTPMVVADRRGTFAFCSQILPAIDPTETYCARVTVYDIAGNPTVSNEACTTEDTLECRPLAPETCSQARECKPAGELATDNESGGCSTNSARGGWLFALLALWFLRRRV